MVSFVAALNLQGGHNDPTPFVKQVKVTRHESHL